MTSKKIKIINSTYNVFIAQPELGLSNHVKTEKKKNKKCKSRLSKNSNSMSVVNDLIMGK